MTQNLNRTKEKYFSMSGLNQSQLKAILAGPYMFKVVEENPRFFEEKEAILIGDAVDTIITEGKDVFQQSYYISTVDKPSATVMSIVQEVFYEERNRTYKLEELEAEILEACDNHNHQSKWKAETRIKKLVEAGTEYWDDLVSADGKEVLDFDQKTTVEGIVTSLTTHPYTKKYFEIGQADGVEITYQVPLHFSYRGIECKAMIDMIIVNHNNFPVRYQGLVIPAKSVQPIDIKTTGEYTRNFPKVVKALRYDIQGAWYTLALESVPQSDLRILPFKFLVESTKVQGDPRVYTMTATDLLVARWGGIFKRGSLIVGGDSSFNERFVSYTLVPEYDVKGFEQAIDDYLWYQTHSECKIEKAVYEAEGEMELNIYG